MSKNLVIGAISGDIIGSVYEFKNVKSTDFPLFSKHTTFTDDSVLTVATMDGLLNSINYTEVYQKYGRKYPNAGYGGNFFSWIFEKDPKPYNSWGNGSAMRVSPVGWAFDTLEEVLSQAKRSAEVTHNHSEGIKGAQATAACIFMARSGKTKKEIKKYITSRFGYNLERKIEDIRAAYEFDESCQGSVPESIIAFLESGDFEDAIRLAISIGGDSDTIACIAGGIAEAFYKDVPDYITEKVLNILPEELAALVEEFSARYGGKTPKQIRRCE